MNAAWLTCMVIALAVWPAAAAWAGPCAWRFDMAHHPLTDSSEQAKRTLNACIDRARAGDAFALHHMGVVWMFGIGVPADFELGVRRIRSAAEKGYDPSSYRGEYFDFPFRTAEGRLLSVDARIREWRKAAAGGDAAAKNTLGMLRLAGLGMSQDFAKAVEWIDKAAKQGDARAEYHLGVLYLVGVGVQQDNVKAASLFRRAAGHGEVEAWEALGGLYADGIGVGRDEAKAVRWFRRAAMRGHARAQYHLGIMMRDGRGVPRDTVQAWKWLALSASMGYRKASLALKKLTALMKPAQIEKARKLKDEWEPESTWLR